MYLFFIKRLIDFFLACLLMLLLFPLAIVIIFMIILATHEKPFYSQLRIGKDERPFRLFKFKTMNDSKDLDGYLLADRFRVTKIGQFLRKFSLDELPQLINVIKGEMSLIGPRPLLIDYLNYYSVTEKLRHTVRPGISGWAQVNGRVNTSWNKRLSLDVYYVEHISAKLDALIIYKTVVNTLIAKDVVQNENRVMLDLNEERKLTIHENRN